MSSILALLTAVLVCGADGCARTVNPDDIYSEICAALGVCDQYTLQELRAAWETFCTTVSECDPSLNSLPDQVVLDKFVAFLAGTATTSSGGADATETSGLETTAAGAGTTAAGTTAAGTTAAGTTAAGTATTGKLW